MSKPKDRTLILCCEYPDIRVIHAREESTKLIKRTVCGITAPTYVYYYSTPAESNITCERCIAWIAEKRSKKATIAVINGGKGMVSHYARG